MNGVVLELMRVLLLTNLLPYPLDNGGKIKTFSTVKALAENGNIVDLFCFTESNESGNNEGEIRTLCNEVHQVYNIITTASNEAYMYRLALKSLFSKYPVSSYKFITNEMKLELLRNRKVHYDVIYFDHLPLFVYYKLCKENWKDARIILDEHNCESNIMKGNAEKEDSLIKKLFMQIEVKKLMKFEGDSVKLADKTIILSNDDYKEIKKLANCDFTHDIIPISVIDKGMKKNNPKKKTVLDILFMATLTWEPNRKGLVWFLDNVVPSLQENGVNYRLYIVGKASGTELLDKTKNLDNVIITGYVESVDEYYDKCDCLVVPLFVGSGQRVKILEAFSKGMPTISTSIGASGIQYENNESILIAETVEDFVDCIIKCNDEDVRRKLSCNARKTYENNYSEERISKLINAALTDDRR